MKKLITLALFLMSFKNPPNYNEVSYKKHNHVINGTDFEGLNMILHISLNELEIENVRVLILPFRKGWKYKLNCKAHIISIDKNNYVIYIDKGLSKREMISVITHESIHLKQFHNGKLFIKPKIVGWGDKTYRRINMMDYHSRPWEKDAFKYGRILSSKLKPILIQ